MNNFIEEQEKYLFKVIIIGDAGVGKSCLLYHYINSEFKDEYSVTLGVEFASKLLSMPDKSKIKLQIWDTAGQESFRSVVKSFYKKAAAVLIVYNMTRRETFDHLEEWLHEIKENADERIVKTLIGTQADRANERKVTNEEGIAFKEKHNLHLYFETSAKTGNNISEVFYQTTEKILDQPRLKESFTKIAAERKEGENKKGGCC